MDFDKSEAKITIAKFIEAAYSKDKGLTTKIIGKVGAAKISIDSNGNATLSGSAGILTFSGKSVLEEIGLKVRRININFTTTDGNAIRYTAKYDLEIVSISVSGEFDLMKMIATCSGLLCIAARALKGRDERLEKEMARTMGVNP